MARVCRKKAKGESLCDRSSVQLKWSPLRPHPLRHPRPKAQGSRRPRGPAAQRPSGPAFAATDLGNALSQPRAQQQGQQGEVGGGGRWPRPRGREETGKGEGGILALLMRRYTPSCYALPGPALPGPVWGAAARIGVVLALWPLAHRTRQQRKIISIFQWFPCRKNSSRPARIWYHPLPLNPGPAPRPLGPTQPPAPCSHSWGHPARPASFIPHSVSHVRL